MLNHASNFYFKRRWSQVLDAQANPKLAQEKAFAALRQNLLGTEVAEEQGLAKIKNYSEFIRSTQEPRHYEALEKFVKRQFENRGKPVLFKDRLRFVGLSSGTTGRNSKHIPFNEGTLRNFESFQLNMAALVERHSAFRILSDSRLTWGSSARVETIGDTPAGYVSGFVASRSPWFLRNKSFPSPRTSLIPSMSEKMELLANEVKDQPIALLSGVPSYLLNLLEHLKETWGLKSLGKIWPKLDTIVYSASSIQPYRAKFEELFERKLKFIGCYGSTEALLGYEIPSLNPQNGIYYFDLENVVLSFRRTSGSRRILGIDELKAGDEVEVFVSTPNGFLHYAMGDCLKIVSVSPHVSFEILGRVGQAMNVATEKVLGEQLRKTVEIVEQKIGCEIPHFFIHPDLSETGRPCYGWNLVVKRFPEQATLEEITDHLDFELMKQNGDYEEARLETKFLDRPNLTLMSDKILKLYFERDGQKGQLKMKQIFETAEDFRSFTSKLVSDSRGSESWLTSSLQELQI